MAQWMAIHEQVSAVVWGIPLLLLLLSTGIYLTVRSGFFQVTGIKTIFQHTIGSLLQSKKQPKDLHTLSQFQAVCTMLAATVGTGNIAGVTTAIALGGAGAVFWMWVSAFFGMMTAYTEQSLGIRYRKRDQHGQWQAGPMIYLEEGLKGKGWRQTLAKPLATAFAFFCLLASFGMGNMAQSNSMSTTLWQAFSIPPLWSGVVVAVLCGVVLLGGVKRLGRVTAVVVPVMAVGYLCCCLVIIGSRVDTLPMVLSTILTEAIGWDAVGGGISGAVLQQALSTGVRRGVFSNEAGMGSMVLAGGVSDAKTPKEQGMWGIFAVFFDTMICCTMTALVVLSTGVLQTSSAEGAALVSVAFTTVFGECGAWFVAIAFFFFAFSTLLAWSFYGQQTIRYLFGERIVKGYLWVFLPMILLGAVANLQFVFALSDTFNGLMAIPNLIGILLLTLPRRGVTGDVVTVFGSPVPLRSLPPKRKRRKDGLPHVPE